MKLISRLFSTGLLAGLFFVFVSQSEAQSPSKPTVAPSKVSAAPSKVPIEAQNALTRFLALNNQGKLKSASAIPLLTGEATRFAQTDTLGQTSAPDAFQLLDSHHVVARVQGMDGKVPVADIYFYLTLSGSTWKVTALRSLALTGMIEMAMEELQKKSKLTAHEQEELANMKLTLSLDRDLRTYFTTHQPQFEKLRIIAAKNPNAAESNLRQLGLNSVSKENGTNLHFVIGGMVDNTVGYLYSPSNRPPQITPNEYIWVEKIADKWYIFRTT